MTNQKSKDIVLTTGKPRATSFVYAGGRRIPVDGRLGKGKVELVKLLDTVTGRRKLFEISKMSEKANEDVRKAIAEKKGIALEAVNFTYRGQLFGQVHVDGGPGETIADRQPKTFIQGMLGECILKAQVDGRLGKGHLPIDALFKSQLGNKELKRVEASGGGWGLVIEKYRRYYLEKLPLEEYSEYLALGGVPGPVGTEGGFRAGVVNRGFVPGVGFVNKNSPEYRAGKLESFIAPLTVEDVEDGFRLSPELIEKIRSGDYSRKYTTLPGDVRSGAFDEVLVTPTVEVSIAKGVRIDPKMLEVRGSVLVGGYMTRPKHAPTGRQAFTPEEAADHQDKVDGRVTAGVKGMMGGITPLITIGKGVVLDMEAGLQALKDSLSDPFQHRRDVLNNLFGGVNGVRGIENRVTVSPRIADQLLTKIQKDIGVEGLTLGQAIGAIKMYSVIGTTPMTPYIEAEKSFDKKARKAGKKIKLTK